MKIHIKLQDKIKDLKGEPVADNPASEILVEALMNGNEGPALALLRISKDLTTDGTAEVTPDEYNTLVGLVEKDRRLTNLGKARILEMMEQGRDAALLNK